MRPKKIQIERTQKNMLNKLLHRHANQNKQQSESQSKQEIDNNSQSSKNKFVDMRIKDENDSSEEERERGSFGSGSESGEIKVRRKSPRNKKPSKPRKHKKKERTRESKRKRKLSIKKPKKTKRIKKKKKKNKKKDSKREEPKLKQPEPVQKFKEPESQSEVDYGEIDEEKLLKTQAASNDLEVDMGRMGRWTRAPQVSGRKEEGEEETKGGKIREEKATVPTKGFLIASPEAPEPDFSDKVSVDAPGNAPLGDSSVDDLFASNSVSQEKQSRRPKEDDEGRFTNDEELYYKPVIGELLHGKYRVLAILGKGVYSLVLKVEHSGRMFALKILRKAEVIRESGKREIEILKFFDAPGGVEKSYIIQMVDWFDHKGFLCIVLEILGLNIRDMLNSKRKGKNFSLDEVRMYAWQMLCALAHLESKGILHLDIKPDNILYDETKRVCKLSDFGTSLETDEVELGKEYVSRYYRAPEVFLGGRLCHGVDVWSMACTFYEMFTGQFLFPGKNDPHMMDLFLVTKGSLSLKYLKKCLVSILVK